MRLEKFAHRKVAIWGYGLEGQAAFTVLRELFPDKPLTLFLTPDEAAQWDFEGVHALEVLTEPPTAGDLAQFQLVVKSPGITPYQREIEWAHFRGTRFVSGSTIWFAHHAQDRTICITGTKGKSTTAALVAHLLRRGGYRTALAGNIGKPLLELLTPVPAPDWWVIELSSYQTADFAGVPAVAVVLNLYPEHLQWHGSEERYYADKLKVLADGRADVAVLNATSAPLMERTADVERKLLFNHPDGWQTREGAVWYRGERVLNLADTRLLGSHNAENICAALTAIEAAGLDARALARHVTTFVPLPHRLQRLGHRGGIDYVDDSISTTPHATIAALQSLADRPTTVLVGGYDRGLPWEAFASHVRVQAPQAIVLMGENAGRIREALERGGTPPCVLLPAADLAEAVHLAQQATPAGGRVLLSPGAPSFDAFRDYAERGRAFARLAGFSDIQDEAIAGLGIA
jgi:UDP-N-acetylmuramoylalanine--D-glutamate ligase